jgi:apolipoprotein D and lipocalin family protein
VAATTLQPPAAQAQAPPPVRAVPFVDLDRHAGDWFEIARFPNRFQRQCVGDVRATCARRPDARLDVVNQCRVAEGQTEARGVARIVDERSFAKLKVRSAPAWLMSHLDDDSLAAARAVARDNGFEVHRVMPTSQPGAARP